METPTAFIAADRAAALAGMTTLPETMEGSVLFADISGFTALLEKLAAQLGPTEAADQLTTQINLVFAALIDQVEQFQGVVVSFGGDALSCWFHLDNGRRATACALAMQAAMAKFTQIELADGTVVTLALKVGLTSGTVRRLAVGDPAIQRLDVMAGAAMLELGAVLQDLERGEIRVGSGALQQIEEELAINAWYLNEHQTLGAQSIARVTGFRPETLPATANPTFVSAPTETTPIVDEALLVDWLLPPVYARVCQEQGRFLNDLRPVVVLFLQFNGLDYVHDTLVGAKLDAFVRWAQHCLARYEGFLLKLTIDDKGSYLLATFGALESHDDNAERAAAAALDLRHAPEEFSFITSVQIGLHQGRILAGAFGSKKRAAYDLLGSAVNLTNRLMTSAAPNQILASKRIIESVCDHFQFGPPTLTPLKGVGDLYLYELRDRLPVSLPIYDEPILEREAELSFLSQILEQVFASQGQIVLIEGEAGIGKSRLVAEFRRRAATIGCIVATAVCESFSRENIYQSWQQILFTLPSIAAEDSLAIHDPLLSNFLGLTFMPGATKRAQVSPQQQATTYARITVLLLTEAYQRPLVLIFEDIQWLDQASVNLLKSFYQHITHVPVLLLFVQRPTSSDSEQLLATLSPLANFHHLALSPLSQKTIQLVIEDQLEGRALPLLLAFIARRAQGNPFYAEELLLALYGLNLLVYHKESNEWDLGPTLIARLQAENCLHKEPVSGEWVLAVNAALATIDLGISDALHQLLLAAIDDLPEACRQIVQIASVIGGAFTSTFLQQIYPSPIDLPSLCEQLQLLVRHQLLVRLNVDDKEQYEFRRHLTGAVVYATMIETQRQTLHAAVAQAIERSQPTAMTLLAYHFSRSHLTEKGCYYLARAAQIARQEEANQTAFNYYNQLLTLDEAWPWLQGKIEVAHILGLRSEEEQTLRKLAAWPTAPRFTVRYLYAQYYAAIGHYELAAQSAEQAFAIAKEQAKPLDQACAGVLLALIARRQGNYEQIQAHCETALALLQKPHLPAAASDRLLVDLYNHCGYAYRQQGAYPQAQLYSERALQLCYARGYRRGEAAALNTMAAIAYYRREFADEERHREAAIQIQRQIGDLAGEGVNLYHRALVLYEAGQLEAAERWALAALQIHQSTEDLRAELNVRNLLGLLYAQFGEVGEATTELQHSLQISGQIGDEAGKAYTLCHLGVVLRDWGRLRVAAEYLEESWQLADRQGDRYLSAMCQSHLAIVRLLEEKFERAIQLAQQALNEREALHAPSLTTGDLTTLARAYWGLGKDEQALDYAERALERLTESYAVGVEFPHHDYFHCATVLRHVGRFAAAYDALQAAFKGLTTRADGISNPTRRQAFLALPPVNSEIMAAFT
jgi:class 3 adenylate cyclase/tetratricopeptide (TPR) repeat protein